MSARFRKIEDKQKKQKARKLQGFSPLPREERQAIEDEIRALAKLSGLEFVPDVSGTILPGEDLAGLIPGVGWLDVENAMPRPKGDHLLHPMGGATREARESVSRMQAGATNQRYRDTWRGELHTSIARSGYYQVAQVAGRIAEQKGGHSAGAGLITLVALGLASRAVKEGAG